MKVGRRGRSGCMSAADQRFVALGDFTGQRTDLEIVVTDLADRGHFGGGTGQPALLEAFQLFGHDP